MLLKKENSTNITHQYKKWNSILKREINWKSLSKYNFKSYAYAPTQNIFYKIQHRAIKANSILASWSRNKDDRTNRCKNCGKIEDIPHIFAHCSQAKEVWQIYENIFKKLVPNQDFSPENCMLAININNLSTPNLTKLLNLTLINYITYELWVTRNKKQFENINTNSEQIIKNINNNINQLLKLKFQKHLQNEDLSNFELKYCINEAICSVNSYNKLQLHLPGK